MTRSHRPTAGLVCRGLCSQLLQEDQSVRGLRQRRHLATQHRNSSLLTPRGLALGEIIPEADAGVVISAFIARLGGALGHQWNSAYVAHVLRQRTIQQGYGVSIATNTLAGLRTPSHPAFLPLGYCHSTDVMRGHSTLPRPDPHVQKEICEGPTLWPPATVKILERSR